MRRLLRGAGLPLALVMLVLMGAIGPAVAQNPADLTFPIRPEPADCQVAPRPVEDLIPILMAEGGEVDADAQTPNEVVLPLGYPAGHERAVEITATLTEVIACLNAGDMLRTLALFTDDGLRRFLGPWAVEEPWTLADVRQLATAAPVAEDQRQSLLGVANVVRLNDGRLTAFALIDDPFESSGLPQALFLYFSYQDGRWRIDDVSELSRF